MKIKKLPHGGNRIVAIEVCSQPPLCICCVYMPQGGGGGGTLKFSVYIGEADFFGVKILIFRIFLGFQKN